MTWKVPKTLLIDQKSAAAITEDGVLERGTNSSAALLAKCGDFAWKSRSYGEVR